MSIKNKIRMKIVANRFIEEEELSGYGRDLSQRHITSSRDQDVLRHIRSMSVLEIIN